ncbi:MAG TPA: ABC transporter substrate-binding protein, partial [Anaerolineaceae bacterium]|nr:ABC transporter substrate-binding protein [Anaerolineaceae bacterium]
MSKKFLRLIVFLVLFSIIAAACSTTSAGEGAAVEEPAVGEAAELDPMEQLIIDAKNEGVLVSYGLPDSWVNYDEMKTLLLEKYSIETQDTDMGSGEIIAALGAEAGAPVADITDLGLNFAKIVEDEELSQPYFHSYWDELPDYAKDPEGRWSSAFWGAIAILVNKDAVTTVPQTWSDLLNDEYIGKVCIKDPRSSA